MQEGIITLLDILGWKGAWQKQNSQSPMMSLEALLTIAEQICEVATDVAKTEKFMGATGRYEVISISDTIAIVSQPAKTVKQIKGQLSDHAMISALLLRYSIMHSIPLRGAISAGKFSKKNNTFIGPAVDEVAAWHEVGEWIGVMAAPSIALRANELVKHEKYGESMIPYKVPTKGGLFDTVCVDWAYEWMSDQADASNFAEVFQQLDNAAKSETDLVECFLKMGPLTPDIYPKYANTLTFFRTRKEVFDRRVKK